MKERIKVVFTSTRAGTIILDEELGTGQELNVISKFNTSFGVRHFPNCELEIKPNSQHPSLILLKSGDDIEIYTGEKKHFSGFLKSVKITATQETVELHVSGISSFYKLEERRISYDNFATKEGLREVLAELLSICGVKGTIIIDKGISNEFSLSPIRSMPALTMINTICYKLDLVYDFNNGEIMSFSKRSDILTKLFSSTPHVINKDDIISSEFEHIISF